MKNTIFALTLFSFYLSNIPVLAANADKIFETVGQKDYGKYECSYNTIEAGTAKRGTCTVVKSENSSSTSGCENLKTDFLIITAIKSGKCKFYPEFK